MINSNYKPKFGLFFRSVALFTILAFSSSLVVFTPKASAQSPAVAGTGVFSLPQPGTLIPLTPPFNPAIIKGIKIFPDNPLRFDFVIDTGDSKLQDDTLTKESTKLIKYFLASLTVPEENLWVNLSPYEKDRIITDDFSKTEMGRDLLAQDYLLKQITASLMFPEEEIGQKFWNKIYQRANDLYGTSEIPVNTFNKVWILPEKAVVYQNGETVFVAESHLKVMLEEDYLALEHNSFNGDIGTDQLDSSDIEAVNAVSASIVRDIIIPELEKEINKGENFAPLRQIYNSMILATWFKRNLKRSLLGQVYFNQAKTQGIEIEDKAVKEKIYSQYLEAFEKGVYDYIKEDYDEATQEVIPRKYFSGGIVGFDPSVELGDTRNPALISRAEGDVVVQSVNLVPHSFANNYINQNLPEDLRAETLLERREKLLQQVQKYPQVFRYGRSARVIPIPGLLRNVGIFAQVGLGQMYGEAVIYIDADYLSVQLIYDHELYEIDKWERKRAELGLSPHEMRQWILDHYDEAKSLSDQWHRDAPGIKHLYEQAGIDSGFFEDIARLYPSERDVLIAAGEDESYDDYPYEWNRQWPRPTEEEFQRAERINHELTARMRSSEESTTEFLAGNFFANSELSGTMPQEKAKTLRALYFKYSTVAKAVLLSMNSEAAASWVDILGRNGEVGFIENDMLEKLISEGLQDYGFSKSAHRHDDEERLKVDYDLNGMVYLLALFDSQKANRIIFGIDGWDRYRIIEAIGSYLRLEGVPGDIALSLQETIRRIPEQERQRIQERLSDEVESHLISLELLTSRTVDAQRIVAESGLPSHWNEAWELPTNLELSLAEEVLERATDEDGYSHDISFVHMHDAGESYHERARTLRAVYFLAPDVAGAFITSFGVGMHGNWKDMLGPLRPSNEPGPVEVEILAGIVNRGLVVSEQDDYARYKGKEARISKNLYGLTGLMGYMSAEMSLGVVERLEDDRLHILLERMAGYVLHEQGVYPEVRNRVFEMLKRIPEEKIQRSRGKLPPEIREFLTSVDKLPLPEVPPLPRVTEAVPRVVGKGVGKLVVIRDDIPDFDTLRRLPSDAVVAMSFLPTSDTRVGPFRGILTFTQEGETSHAQARSRIWQVPHALWPGADSLTELDGKDVVFEVTGNQVNIREAREEDLLNVGQEETTDVETPARTVFPSATLEAKKVPGLFGEGELEDKVYLGQNDPDLRDPKQVGYKVALLNQLATQPPNVSDSDIHVEIATGAAFPFYTFVQHLEIGEQLNRFKSLIGDLQSAGTDEWRISSILRNIRDLFDRIKGRRSSFQTDELHHQFVMGDNDLEGGLFVRTSTNVENIPEHPGVGAGIYKTVPNVRGQYRFFDALKEVWASVWSEEAFWERRRLGIDETQVFPAVWLVPSVAAKYSFVIHTSSVSTQQPNQTVIEVVQGLGESLVGNDPMFAGFPSRMVWDKTSQSVVSQNPSTKQRRSVLAEAGGMIVEPANGEEEFLNQPDVQRLIQALVEVGGQTEEFFGQAQEIEGALTFDQESGQWTVTMLQTRFVDTPDAPEPTDPSDTPTTPPTSIAGEKDSSGADQAALEKNRSITEEEASSDQLGGIDFNPNNLDLQTQGESIDFNFPIDSYNVQSFPINGFTPVIFQTVPISSLPLYLGMAEQNEGTDSKAYNSTLDPIESRNRFKKASKEQISFLN